MPVRTNFYNGNPNIKRGGILQEYTKEQVLEYVRCKNDPIYFIKKYCVVVNLDRGLVPFELRPYQERMVKNFAENRFTINLLPRQMGKTVTVAAYLLHASIFTPHFLVGVLANKAATAREILSKLKRMLESVPFFLQPGILEYNKGSIIFDNGSSIIAESTNSDAVRGFSFNIIYLDEFAFVPQAVEFYASTYPVISSGKNSKVIITSTPCGLNLFYKLWSDAIDGRSAYVPVEVKYTENTNYTGDWKETTLSNMTQREFDQEYLCKFHGSSGTLIDGETLTRLVWADPITETSVYRVYEEPIDKNLYMVTVDPSMGIGADYTTIIVSDITAIPYKQVAVYRNNTLSPMLAPQIIFDISVKYNNAHVLFENNCSPQIGETLQYDYEYENLILTKEKRGIITISFGSGGSRPGVTMTKKVKRTGCSALKTIIENGVYTVTDMETINEFGTFISKKSSYEAEQGKNDDLVMSLVLFSWATEQEFFKDLTGNDAAKVILAKKLDELKEQLMPLGFSSTSNDNSSEPQEDLSLIG